MLAELVNAHGQGRCAITLDPRAPARPAAYQGVVPLAGPGGVALRAWPR
jgi:molecular chaperone Hsp33